MKHIVTLVLLNLSLYCYSQNLIFVGTKSYTATSSWNFSPPKRTFSDDGIIVQIGKSPTGGIFMISVASEFGQASIDGAVLIYLKDGKVISLTNKITDDYANDRISVIYVVTSNSIDKMKGSNIANVRFTYAYPNGRKMGLSARNGQLYDNGIFINENVEIQTASEITELFSR